MGNKVASRRSARFFSSLTITRSKSRLSRVRFCTPRFCRIQSLLRCIRSSCEVPLERPRPTRLDPRPSPRWSLRLLEVERNEFRLPGRFRQFETGEAYGQREAARPGAAWIDIEDAIAPVRFGSVRVARDDDLNAGRLGIEVEVFEMVQDVNGGWRKAHHRGSRKAFRPRLGIHIAADGVKGRDGSESIEDERVADIAGVDDGVGTLQGGESFRTKQSVRVGDQAKDEGVHPGRVPEREAFPQPALFLLGATWQPSNSSAHLAGDPRY